MFERSFQGIPPMLGSHHILFQAPAVVNEKVYISLTLVALFDNANVLVKALTLLFIQISTDSLRNSPSVTAESAVCWTFVPRVSVNSSVALQFLFRILNSGGFSDCQADTLIFTQCFVKHLVLHEFSYLRAVKYISLEFLHAYPWELLLEETKAAVFPIHWLLHYS